MSTPLERLENGHGGAKTLRFEGMSTAPMKMRAGGRPDQSENHFNWTLFPTLIVIFDFQTFITWCADNTIFTLLVTYLHSLTPRSTNMSQG